MYHCPECRKPVIKENLNRTYGDTLTPIGKSEVEKAFIGQARRVRCGNCKKLLVFLKGSL